MALLVPAAPAVYVTGMVVGCDGEAVTEVGQLRQLIALGPGHETLTVNDVLDGRVVVSVNVYDASPGG
jgi:hypothetical protein